MAFKKKKYNIARKEKELDLWLTSCTKINSGWFKDQGNSRRVFQ
jgi:hypothetical protein